MNVEPSSVGATFARVGELQRAIAQLDGSPATSATGSTEFAGVLSASDAAPTGGEHTQFAQDVLAGLGAPATAENVRAIVAWARAEGTSAAFNPLATTQSMPDATSFNSVGVKNYASYRDGLTATLRTLTNGRYEPIIAALRRGGSADAVARAIAASPWGTGAGVLRVLASGG